MDDLTTLADEQLHAYRQTLTEQIANPPRNSDDLIPDWQTALSQVDDEIARRNNGSEPDDDGCDTWTAEQKPTRDNETEPQPKPAHTTVDDRICMEQLRKSAPGLMNKLAEGYKDYDAVTHIVGGLMMLQHGNGKVGENKYHGTMDVLAKNYPWIAEENEKQPEPQPTDTPQTEPAQPVWQFRTLKQAYELKPPREYLTEGLLPLPSLTVVYGSPGSLKTMLIQDLAVCVAAGKSWLIGDNIDGFEAHQTGVIWIDVDNGLDRLERRFSAIGKGHDAPEDAPLAFISFPNPPFVANNPDSVQMIVEAIDATNAKLIVFDNLGTISGGMDENSSQMVAVMSGLRQIAETTKTAVVVIHHANKYAQGRTGNRLRGHSSIEGAVDLALLVEREEGSEAVTLSATKSRDSMLEPFGAMFSYTAFGNDLLKAHFIGTGKPEIDTDTLPAKDKAKICIKNNLFNAMTQTQIVDMVKELIGTGRNTTLSALNELVNRGDVSENTRDGRTKEYVKA